MAKRKPSIRDASHHTPTAEEVAALRAALKTADALPIVVAILGVAMLEHELDKMLRRRFRRQDDDTWKLLTEYGPLGDFSSKIKAGYAVRSL